LNSKLGRRRLVEPSGNRHPRLHRFLDQLDLLGGSATALERSDQAERFVVLPKRWIVERTFAWLSRCRRLAKDWECLNRKAVAFLKLASIRLMLRKLCNPR
jgi:transposase